MRNSTNVKKIKKHDAVELTGTTASYFVQEIIMHRPFKQTLNCYLPAMHSHKKLY